MVNQTNKSTQLEILRHNNYNCIACSNRSKCKQVSVGWGALNPKILVVTEQPTTEEAKLGKSFGGRSIPLVESICGIGRSQIYFTTLVKCPGLSKKTAAICKMWLINEISLLSPPIIMAMGRASSNILLNRKFSSPILSGWNQNIFTCYAPTYLLNHPSEIENVKLEFKNRKLETL